MDHPRPGLRYVDAGDLDGSVKFDGLEVDSFSDEKLGTVDGFVVDVNSGRPYYVVVDAGGWFSSKYFLLPIGHAGLDAADKKLVADLSKDHVAKYPGFDRDVFDELSSKELDRIDREMAKVCCPEEAADNDVDYARRYETWKHYQNETWWDTKRGSWGPLGSLGSRSSWGSQGSRGSQSSPSRDAVGRNAREEELLAAKDRDASDTEFGDVSPHLGGRAQPGDVLGLETGGERTHVGETSDDENERRRDAEKTAAQRRRD